MLLLLVSALSLAPTCGKRTPPLPPVERIPQRTEELTGSQHGNLIVLTWPAPRRNAGGGSVQSIRRVDVYRVAEKPNAPLPMTEEEFAARSILVGSVTYDEIKKAGNILSFSDPLELAGVPARLRYAIRYVNEAGQRAAFSNFFQVEPAAKIAEPPAKVSGEITEKALIVRWEAPQKNIDGSTPVNLLGYNLYRSTSAEPNFGKEPVNQAPLAGSEYQDRSFKFGEKYSYIVRSVSLGTEGKPVESLDSERLTLAPVDIFPPSAPERPFIGPAPGKLSIFWTANSEPDIAGYYLYRSTDPNLPKDKWTKLTSALYSKITFTDENVESRKTYYYYVIAVDTAGNASPPSEVASETVP